MFTDVVFKLFCQISDNQDSLDPQENSFTRTIDEEAELEERADREREEGHQEQDDEEEEREHEVMTAGSEYEIQDFPSQVSPCVCVSIMDH